MTKVSKAVGQTKTMKKSMKILTRTNKTMTIKSPIGISQNGKNQ